MDVLPAKLTQEITTKFGTPLFLYDLRALRERVNETLSFPNAYGLTVRYAMKANSNAAILQVFREAGLHIDASSGYEAHRALHAGYSPREVCLCTQELPTDFTSLVHLGVCFDASSIYQLTEFAKSFPGQEVGLRFNPGIGSGGSTHTNVGGPSSSFGIWHENAEKALDIVSRYGIKVVRIHTHIGSGSDPDIWHQAALLSLNIVRKFTQVHTLNLGGGFKVARVSSEVTTDLLQVGVPVKRLFELFAKETGRHLHLEIEPGTYLTANAGVLLTTIQDQTDTGLSGYIFLKLDCGMTEILRPAIYGAQYPVHLYSSKSDPQLIPTVIVGHCCESGDLLTPAPNVPAQLKPRNLPEVNIGDLCLIAGTGAYCSSMATKNYNSFPEAAEVMLDLAGVPHLIRRRQTLSQIVENEIPLAASCIKECLQ